MSLIEKIRNLPEKDKGNRSDIIIASALEYYGNFLNGLGDERGQALIEASRKNSLPFEEFMRIFPENYRHSVYVAFDVYQGVVSKLDNVSDYTFALTEIYDMAEESKKYL